MSEPIKPKVCENDRNCERCRDPNWGAWRGAKADKLPKMENHECPFGKPWGWRPEGSPSFPLPVLDEGSVSGPAIWLEIHAQLKPTLQWWQTILARVSRLPGCGCQKHLAVILAQLRPIDFSTPDTFFVWSVDLHNAINAELGKVEMKVADARLKYNRLAA